MRDMRNCVALSVLFLLYFFVAGATSQDIPDETWKYVKVRDNAFMFWWLYGAETANPGERSSKPLIIWVQGGPGASGTGFGNFVEIGAEDIHGNKRDYTWLKVANVLFVDNPVGTGFSYVTDNEAYTTNVSGIATDLLTMFSSFLDDMPVFKTTPLYIFCESYGGKMSSAFAVALYDAIQNKRLECNFKGVALGDSWISPVDTVLTWGQYLYSFSLLDGIDLVAVNKIANDTAIAFYKGDYVKSTELWSKLEDEIAVRTDNVNVYNVLQHNVASPVTVSDHSRPARLFKKHVGYFQNDMLSKFMNGPVREKLGIIPPNVTWGGQSADVFSYQVADFMKPVVKDVSKLLNYGVRVAIYEGQLDMICDTAGAEVWLKKLTWSGLDRFLTQAKQPLYAPSQVQSKNTGGFVKEYENLQFYYLMKAGHMVPQDAPEMALAMVERIMKNDQLYSFV